MNLKIASIFTAIIILSFGAFAQTVPPSQTIGATEQRDRALEEQKAIEQQIQTKKKKPEIKEEPVKEAPLPADTKKVQIKKIVVEGATLLSEKELKGIVSGYEGKDLALSEMQKIADKITESYRKKGYTTSRAYLPPQTIKDGILTIKIIEGKVGKIDIKGNRYFRTSLLEKKIKLKPKDYFDYDILQNSLTYINENPDRMAKAILVPGVEPGTTDIVIEVKDRLPIHIGFDYDNFGSRYMEKNRWAFVYENNNLLGFDDKLYLKYQMSQKSLYSLKNVRYIYPVNEKTEIGGYYSYSRLVLGKEFRALSAVGKANIAGIFVNRAVFENRILDLRYNFGFDYKDIKNYLSGAESSRDEMRVIKNGLDIDITDKFGRTIITPEIDVGIPRMWGGLTAKDSKASRVGAGGQFVKGVFNFYRLQPMPFSSSLLLKNSAQLSNYNLAAAEQFQIGGAQSVRGYGPGEFAGDKGIYSSAEWSFPVYGLPKGIMVPTTGSRLYDAVRLVCFYDWANSRLNNPQAGEEKSDTLRGWGYGVRFNVKDLSLKFEMGYPLGKLPSDGNRAHPWVEFSWRF
ncbi:MAG: BamA/TamA family outer membrane protein [Candidatus Omnitrophica bacterium]|jgi:hemolysin activation/secretion protein|nr:BamA/TamA family outer membrane protein [Candidatus Omnitrophota bacterium]